MTEANTPNAEHETQTAANRFLDRIRVLAPLKPTDPRNLNAKDSRSVRFENYQNQNVFSNNVPTYVEYLAVGISQDNGYLRGQIIEVLIAKISENNLDYSISRAVYVKRINKEMRVFTRIDSEIAPRVDSITKNSKEYIGEVPPEIINLLPERFPLNPDDAPERELNEEEIEQEIIKAGDLISRQIKRRH